MMILKRKGGKPCKEVAKLLKNIPVISMLINIDHPIVQCFLPAND